MSSWVVKDSVAKEKNQADLNQYLKNINLSFEFIFSLIEDIQDLAKFSNNQQFQIYPENFNIRDFLKDLLVLFDEQCKFKGVELK